VRVLVVHAHPEPRSFCSALKDLALEALPAAGHEVALSDLYAMGWKAVADAADFSERADPAFLKYQAEQRRAAETGGFSADIAAEMEKLRRADGVILNFPMWWFGLPAILKGWIDRVLAVGFAYGGGRWFDTGPLRGRRAMVAMTTGGLPDRFSDGGLFGPIATVLHPLRVGTLNFVGLDTVEPFIAWGAAQVSPERRAAYLAAYRERLLGFETAPLEPFRRLADYPSPAPRDH
jgi:NAD(P)H dehydrogenase (quinone)